MSKSDLENPKPQEPNTEETETLSKVKEGGAPSGTGSANLEAITDNLSAEMPEVQEHALAQEQENEKARSAEYADLRDRDGNPFDPSVHKTNKAGEPTLSTKGLLVKKPGRKAGTKTTQSVVGSTGDSGAGSSVGLDQVKQEQQARATGVVAANMLVTLGVVVGGEEWQPMKDKETGIDEKTMLESAFGDYFVATGKTDLPPNMALTVAISGYVLPRFFMPKTKTRFQKFALVIKKWWANKKLKKHGLKAEKADEGK